MKSREARIKLITQGVTIRGQSVSVLGQNPFVSSGDQPTTKLIIGNLPISIANQEIVKALEKMKVKIRSPLREEKYRDENGGITRFKTGRRFVYIEIPETPLPKTTQISDSFVAYLYYREQSKQSQTKDDNSIKKYNENSHKVGARNAKKKTTKLLSFLI